MCVAGARWVSRTTPKGTALRIVWLPVLDDDDAEQAKEHGKGDWDGKRAVATAFRALLPEKARDHPTFARGFVWDAYFRYTAGAAELSKPEVWGAPILRAKRGLMGKLATRTVTLRVEGMMKSASGAT